MTEIVSPDAFELGGLGHYFPRAVAIGLWLAVLLSGNDVRIPFEPRQAGNDFEHCGPR